MNKKIRAGIAIALFKISNMFYGISRKVLDPSHSVEDSTDFSGIAQHIKDTDCGVMLVPNSTLKFVRLTRKATTS